MLRNIGRLDRLARITVGIALLAYALGLIFPNTGWNWIGWIGLVAILTAVTGFCPAYRVLGIRTGR